MSHRHVLLDLVYRNGWTHGAELGVASGQCMRLLLERCPELRMIGVDAMRRPDRAEILRSMAEEFGDRLRLIESTTERAADMVEDASLDFVFVDADHRYAGVMIDLEKWTPKVRSGGRMLGHDYNRDKFPGVIQAVDRFFGKDAVHVLPHHVWMVQL